VPRWQVTGVDFVPTALRRGRERAKRAEVEVEFLRGDVTRLEAGGVGSGNGASRENRPVTLKCRRC
jgi:methyltransferase family protein